VYKLRRNSYFTIENIVCIKRYLIMHYRSSLFHGVVIITTIASLIIVQSCTKQVQAGADRDLADTKQALAVSESDRVSVAAQALGSLNACSIDIRRDPDCERYVQYRSTLENWCKSGDREVCKFLLKLKQIEGGKRINEQIQRQIGERQIGK
jgi:hypothetical protein